LRVLTNADDERVAALGGETSPRSERKGEENAWEVRFHGSNCIKQR